MSRSTCGNCNRAAIVAASTRRKTHPRDAWRDNLTTCHGVDLAYTGMSAIAIATETATARVVGFAIRSALALATAPATASATVAVAVTVIAIDHSRYCSDQTKPESWRLSALGAQAASWPSRPSFRNKR